MKSILFSRLYRTQLLACSFVAITALLASCSKSDGYGGGGTTTNYNLSASLNSGNEVPSNPTSGTGTLSGTYNPSTYKVTYTLTWTGLTDVPIAMHFHGPALAGVNAGVEVPITGFASTASGTLSSSATFSVSQGTELTDGKMYVNIHTTAYPNGEIRGQISAVK
ncbi:CHRD domain-containing protein [Chitinophaga sp. CF118]|uniref:CHRD domain-containing protein n=1 Tax=Chitinophaga sp. CF118 TaxID=1884367 RepID=UPI0008F30219|nr:CHRD domain-containing protein [Chitinophaga sp. CF118]SFD58353.1 CHRD domain-containing protein [Chitinophaga sp. CF118]